MPCPPSPRRQRPNQPPQPCIRSPHRWAAATLCHPKAPTVRVPAPHGALCQLQAPLGPSIVHCPGAPRLQGTPGCWGRLPGAGQEAGRESGAALPSRLPFPLPATVIEIRLREERESCLSGSVLGCSAMSSSTQTPFPPSGREAQSIAACSHRSRPPGCPQCPPSPPWEFNVSIPLPANPASCPVTALSVG